MSKQCKGQVKPTAKAWNANHRQTFLPYYHNDPNVNGNHKVTSLNLILSLSHTHILSCRTTLLWNFFNNCCNQNKAQIPQAMKSFPQFIVLICQLLGTISLPFYPSPKFIPLP